MSDERDIDTDMTARMRKMSAAFRMSDNRMCHLPIYNRKLDIEVVEARPWRDFYIGILITPWTMNLILLPQEHEDSDDVPTGTRRDIELPGGRCTFFAGDSKLAGQYWACSLFSPVTNIKDQAMARAIAGRIMADLLLARDTETEDEKGSGRSMTRQELFRGRSSQ